MTDAAPKRGPGRLKDPNIAAKEPAILERLAVPGMNYSQVAREFEISRTQVLRIARRARKEEVEELKAIPEEMDFGAASEAELLTDLKRIRGLVMATGFSVQKIRKAGLQQTALTVAILTDKIELLSGRPTQRLSIEDRRSREEIAKALLAELGRRGIAAPAPQVELQPAEFVEVPG